MIPLLILCAMAAAAADPVTVHLLPPGPGNPRNTEGDFIPLKDGRILFAYTKFTGGTEDHATAHIASRVSTDGGRSWSSEDAVLVPNEGGMNVMSVSFLRLASGEIALFYARKNSMLDCRPYMRVSKNEGKTWSKPKLCIREVGYYVLNNDRAHQLKSGRIVLPVALHKNETNDPSKFNGRGVAMCYLSDNKGKTWRRSKSIVENPSPSPVGLQEPGVVELKDGRLLMYTRTGMGTQYFSYSSDGGETWTAPEASSMQSPVSPATIERIPQTGDLLAVWNDHSNVDESIKNKKRTPLTAAISRDEGKTWEKAKNLMQDPEGWYCYTAMEFVGDRVLLGYNAGGSGLRRLSRSAMTWFDLDWLYERSR